MNSRDYKVFRSGHFYHIYNRGVNKEDIFLDKQDYFNFLKRVKIILGQIPVTQTGLRLQPLLQNSIEVCCYCLMPNHFHFLIHQITDIPIGDFITKLCTSYVKYFNGKYGRVGNLFQDIFKAKLVDNDAYLTYLSAYIHNNPSDPLTYPYSSFPDYIGMRNGTICNTATILSYFNNNRKSYQNFVIGYKDTETPNIQHLLFEED